MSRIGFAEAPTFQDIATGMQMRQEIVVQQGKLTFVKTEVYFETEAAFEKFLSQISNMAVPQSDPRTYILKQLDTASSMGKRVFFSFGTYYYKGEKAHLTQKLDPERMKYVLVRKQDGEEQFMLRKPFEESRKVKPGSTFNEYFFDSETVRHYDWSKMKRRIISADRRYSYFRICDIDIGTVDWSDALKSPTKTGQSLVVVPTDNPNIYNVNLTSSEAVVEQLFDLSVHNFTRITGFYPPTRKKQLVLQSDFHVLGNGVYVPFVHLEARYHYSGPSEDRLKYIKCEIYIVELWQNNTPSPADLVEGENIDITKFLTVDERVGIKY
jgi:hypothetical protein